MGHSNSLVQLILKNLRLLNDANDNGLHHSALYLGDKSHFENAPALVDYLKQQNLIESDYDDSVGVWFLSDYGLSCYKEGHFEPKEILSESDHELEADLNNEEKEETLKSFNLGDSIAISSKQFTSIGKMLWGMMFVVALLVTIENFYFPKEPEFPLDIKIIKSTIGDDIKLKLDSINNELLNSEQTLKNGQ